MAPPRDVHPTLANRPAVLTPVQSAGPRYAAGKGSLGRDPVEEGPALATARGEEFVIASGSDQVPERLAAALEPRFTVVRETRRRARQVWVDTFDGRLHAAGLTLRQVAGAGSVELVLSTS